MLVKIFSKALILFFSVIFCFQSLATFAQSSNKTLNSKSDSIKLINFAKRVLHAVKASNFTEFEGLIHPKLGVRFSPYAYTDIKSDLKFTRAKFRDGISRKKRFIWGEEDPTGVAIKMTIPKYFRKYVYGVDFLKLNEIAINEFISGGNTLNNLKEVYKNFEFIEFHCKGVEEKYGGMDWQSVRLVVSSYKGKLYLVGVVHDEWTI